MKIKFINSSLYNGSCVECVQILYDGFSYLDWWRFEYKSTVKRKNPTKLHSSVKKKSIIDEIDSNTPTLYIGELRAEKRIRIYNKTKELIANKDLVKENYIKTYYKKNGIDCSNIERLELELRKRSAHKYKLQDLFNSSCLNQILYDELLGKKNKKGVYIHSFFRFTKPDIQNGKYAIRDCTPIRFDRLPKKEVKHIPQTYKRATNRQHIIRILKSLYKDVYVNKNTGKYLMSRLKEDYYLIEYFNKKHRIWEKEWDSELRHEPV